MTSPGRGERRLGDPGQRGDLLLDRVRIGRRLHEQHEARARITTRGGLDALDRDLGVGAWRDEPVRAVERAGERAADRPCEDDEQGDEEERAAGT